MTYTTYFGVESKDVSKGAPYGVRRRMCIYGITHVEDCGHRHTSESAARKCLRRMTRGVTVGASDEVVEMFTRSEP